MSAAQLAPAVCCGSVGPGVLAPVAPKNRWRFTAPVKCACTGNYTRRGNRTLTFTSANQRTPPDPRSPAFSTFSRHALPALRYPRGSCCATFVLLGFCVLCRCVSLLCLALPPPERTNGTEGRFHSSGSKKVQDALTAASLCNVLSNVMYMGFSPGSQLLTLFMLCWLPVWVLVKHRRLNFDVPW